MSLENVYCYTIIIITLFPTEHFDLHWMQGQTQCQAAAAEIKIRMLFPVLL